MTWWIAILSGVGGVIAGMLIFYALLLLAFLRK